MLRSRWYATRRPIGQTTDTGAGWDPGAVGGLGPEEGPTQPTRAADIPLLLRSGGAYGNEQIWDEETGTYVSGDQIDRDLEVLLYSPYGANRSAMFPTILPARATVGQLVEVPYMLAAAELQQMQMQLWRAGYYGEQAINSRSEPKWGIVDPETAAAWTNFVGDMALHVKSGVAGDELLTQRIASFAGVHESAGIAARSIGDVTISTVDPAEIEANAQQIATAKLGRRLTSGEAAAITGIVTSQDFAQQMANASAQRSSALAQAGLRADGSDPLAQPRLTPAAILTEGDQAHTFGAALAQTFGVTRAKESGRGGLTMTFTGGTAELQALTDWAVAHRSEGGLVESSSVRDLQMGAQQGPPTAADIDELTVTFRAGAALPDFAALAAPADQGRETRAFLDTMRTFDGGQGYLWAPDEGQRGMYQMSERQMRVIAQSRGWDTSDLTSPRAQEAIAQAYAEDLYAEFKDWRMVAVAFRSSPTVARQYEAAMLDPGDDEGDWVSTVMGQRPSVGEPSSLRSYVNKVTAGMAKKMRAPDAGIVPLGIDDLMAEGYGAGVAGGNVIVQPQVNTTARTELQMEAAHGEEMGATHVGRQWDDFMRTIGGNQPTDALTGNPGEV
jgi:hypothetical protein